MKIYHLPETINLLIFDIDSTLYTNSEYAYEQVDIQIRHLAQLRGEEPAKMRSEILDFRTQYRNDTGQAISLGNTLTHFGVSIGESIKWREELLEPARFLARDESLIQALTELKKSFLLTSATNNPVSIGRKTLEALGVSDFFTHIIGLDTTGFSKPHERPFILAAEQFNILPANCVSIGDRYDIDIELPLQLGMGGILVKGVQDVYSLPSVFSSHSVH